MINLRTSGQADQRAQMVHGFYPAESEDVLIDGCAAIGASDAGIYVGQSRTLLLEIVLLNIT